MSALVLRRIGWHHPEAGAVALVALAWALLALTTIGEGGLGALHLRVHEQHPVAAAAAGWLLMATAMMLPTALPAARHLALNALWARRRRTVVLFLGSYLAVWAAFGAVAIPLAELVRWALAAPESLLLASVLGLAAAWQLAARKWRLVRLSHQIAPLAPAGRRADRACVAAGLRYGRLCAAACWPVMLAMAVAGHGSLALMVLLTALLVCERGAHRPARLAPATSALLAYAALVTLAA